MDPLLELHKYGQSYWLDNLTRGMIRSGQLQKMVQEEGLRGITSNPAIFNKAISGSTDYDDQIESLTREGKRVDEVYEAVTIKDVQDACDLLYPVYEESRGVDGFVSLEVSPYLAHDTEGTMAEARRLARKVDRPNLFIKIPGTAAGVPAIEEMLYEGININITLLFSISDYESVAKAYIRALERRLEKGDRIDSVASVASFFLSRIDVLVDELLGHRIKVCSENRDHVLPQLLLGKSGIASAKLAYQSFQKLFSGQRWEKLAAEGARVQRVLWASTSTKDPLYNDVRYVEPLIGPHTVNTLPDETIEAFRDHGRLEERTIEQKVDEVKEVLENLARVGIDIDQVTAQLQNEGVEKFIVPYDQLMGTLTKARRKVVGCLLNSQALHNFPGTLSAALKSAQKRQMMRRLFSKDFTLWIDDEGAGAAIRNRLGWLDAVGTFQSCQQEIIEFAGSVREQAFKKIVLLGMGGSSLCPEVAARTFGSVPGWPSLTVLDNTDPGAVDRVLSGIDPKTTLFVVSSKSGTTVETLSFFHFFYSYLRNQGIDSPGKHFVAITDPDTPLAQLSEEKGFLRTFLNPEDIGGRYSALSYFGLVPMALMGIDISALLDRARVFLDDGHPFVPTAENPACTLGVALGVMAREGIDKVTFLASESVESFAIWAEQLLAESTGKSGEGLIPVVGEPAGEPEDYGSDRLFVWINDLISADKELADKAQALRNAGFPLVQIDVQEKISIGAEFLRWEIATAVAGAVLGVNPFDEPNVAESKANTSRLLDEWSQAGKFPEPPVLSHNESLSIFGDREQKWMSTGTPETSAILDSLLDSCGSSDYLALLAYFEHTPKRDEALQELRRIIRDRKGIATTLGYGPRYLHSTGQLHKGGPETGVFLLLTAEAQEEHPIPGR
ncbi:MAG TPA: bifunctional transaldolase/phosoglucose isomerase, partial [Acidobacteriota bacterium]|nr:bifunctional transaldolase/phosoglucose isomerase [Acidobacteriota bacterium]